MKVKFKFRIHKYHVVPQQAIPRQIVLREPIVARASFPREALDVAIHRARYERERLVAIRLLLEPTRIIPRFERHCIVRRRYEQRRVLDELIASPPGIVLEVTHRSLDGIANVRNVEGIGSASHLLLGVCVFVLQYSQVYSMFGCDLLQVLAYHRTAGLAHVVEVYPLDRRIGCFVVVLAPRYRRAAALLVIGRGADPPVRVTRRQWRTRRRRRRSQPQSLFGGRRRHPLHHLDHQPKLKDVYDDAR